MALNFPDSPTLNQVYTDNVSGFSFQWDGVVWQSYTPTSSNNINIVDDIAGSFNGSTQTFSLAVSGIALTPANAQQLLVVLGGIVQEPIVDYTVSGSSITFTDPPAAGLNISIVSLGPAVPVNTVIDGTITPAKLSTGGPVWNTAGGLVVTGIATVNSVSIGNTEVISSSRQLKNIASLDATTTATIESAVSAAPNDFSSLYVSGISTLGYSSGVGTVRIGSGSTTLIVEGNARITGVVTAIGSGLTGVSTNFVSAIGIQSAGTTIGAGITQLNFIGAGNTFAVNGTTVDISISGSGGGGVSTSGITTGYIWSNPNSINESIDLTKPNHNYGMFGPVTISVGATVTVGVGNTFKIV